MDYTYIIVSGLAIAISFWSFGWSLERRGLRGPIGYLVCAVISFTTMIAFAILDVTP